MTTAVIGQALMLLAVAASLAGVAASVAATRPGPHAPWWRRTGERATRLLLGSSLAGSAVLLVALVSGNFTLSYVAQRTSTSLPVVYRLTAIWSGQEGSLLFWLTLLALLGGLMLRSLHRAGADHDHAAWANAVLCGVATFFALLVAFVARPFAIVERIGDDGTGLSPALQNYWMAAHPPALYVGYVGMTVPFALVAGALLARRSDDAWVRLTRRWTLVAWIGLTIGLLFGARWAYEEIGWGGYWAWDPVENAALMPWLTATAFLHSIMVQERRGMMRYWNAVLVALTFALSIFGTFLTRSGILSSVHSFVSTSVGYWFLGFLALVAAGSMLVLYRSRSLLRARHDVETVVSREAAFLFNNLLLVAIAMTVLWGVLFPILTAGLAGERVSLQAPFFNFFAIAFGLPLLAVMALGPVVSWRRSTLRDLVRGVAWPLAAALVTGIGMVAAGLASSWPGVAATSFGVLVTAGIVREFVRGARARREVDPALSRMRAALSLLGRNRRRYGGYVTHAALGLMVIGIAGSSAYTSDVERTLARGETVRHGGYALTYTDSVRRMRGGSMQVRARFDVRRGGRAAGTLEAGRNFYPVSGEVSNEVGIRPSPFSGEDLYVIVDRLTEDGRVHVKVIVNPLVNLLWLAGVLLVAGGVLAALPQRTPRRAGAAIGQEDDAPSSPATPAAEVGEPART